MRVASTPAEIEQALELRRRVFCGEQGVAAAADQDGRDGEATHYVAAEDGAVIGTCRVLMDAELARLGRMAVEPEHRRTGLGTAILAKAEHDARVAGAQRMRLHAQSAVATLYARAGYRALGEEFVEEGIAHLEMEKVLA